MSRNAHQEKLLQVVLGPHLSEKSTTLVMDLLHPVKTVQDRSPEPPPVQEIPPDRLDRLRPLDRPMPPVRPHARRQQRRISPALEPLDPPELDHVPPVIVEIGEERTDARNARMNVAIDRADEGF
jgi:hypothetical protein